MSRKKVIVVVGVVVIIAAFIVFNLKKGKGGEIPVQVEKVKRGDITQVVSASGKVQPEVEVKISANISAEIIGLYVKEGDEVQRGRLLVRLDSTKYRAAVERAKSNKKSAEANLLKANSDYKRSSDLYRQKLTSQADLESAEANRKLAESQLEQAEADLKQALDDLSKTKLYSPLNGTVTQVNKEVGEIALGSMFQADVILVVSDLTRMEVISEVDENDVVLVTDGDTTEIEVDALPDTTFMGVVSEIAHSATTRGRGTQEEITNFEVKIAILDKEEKLRPGMSATVDIRTETHYGVVNVPIQAVTARDRSEINNSPGAAANDNPGKTAGDERSSDTGEIGKNSDREELVEVVFVVKDGIAKMVPVKMGISSDTDLEIIGGLEEGQEVVTGSYRALTKTLKNGSTVKITQKPALKSN